MNADTLDLCKENVQPLKQGRRANKLGLALLAQEDAGLQEQLLKEREEHELNIMTYEGPDPLEPRYDYVHWIEQSCPKHGKEVNLIPLLEDTIMLFKEDDRYKQDTRFIELIVKYIETQDNPIELFQMVYAQGLGTKCSSFYKAWADQLDMNNDLQRADKVFQMGLENGAEPKKVIEDAHILFQMSVGRRMMIGQLATVEKSVSSETADRQRRVLGKIKNGGTLRPSSGRPGKLSLLSSKPLSNHNASSGFSVYQEDENGCPIKTTKTKLNINSEQKSKENTVKPGKWNEGPHRRHASASSAPVAAYVPSTPTFKVLVDEEEDETPQKPTTATPVPSSVLKTRKAELKHHAEDLFKSPHPNAKPHLPVFEAFAGGREFCFDELRWAYLSKKMNQLKNGEETPMKALKDLTTPCKSSTKSPTSDTPCTVKTLDYNTEPYKTPASSRSIYPIPESPSDEIDYQSERLRAFSIDTPSQNLLNEDGIYPIPNTPSVSNVHAADDQTPSTSAVPHYPTDTPRTGNCEGLIARPKPMKPAKSAPFVVFTDD